MGAARNMNVQNMIFASLKKKVALGNSRRCLKDVASDLLNALGEDANSIAKGTFLCPQTVMRVMDCEDGYSPRADTLERCFRYCNAEIVFNEAVIKPQYKNQPKETE